MSNKEVTRFNNYLRIFPTYKEVITYNVEYIELLLYPYLILYANYKGNRIKDINPSKANNLLTKFPLIKDYKIILTENL